VIEAGKRAERRTGEIDRGIDQELLGQFNDRAVGSADMSARTPLRSQPGDDLDDEIDLIRQQRIEIYKSVAANLWEPDVRSHARVVDQPAPVFVIQSAERLFGLAILGKNTATCHFRDV
jgi:hypothetical protein